MSVAANQSPSWSVERDLARRALDTAKTRGASYTDVRFVRRATEDALVKNGALEAVDRHGSFGFAVRAVADSAWGFAASQVSRRRPRTVSRATAPLKAKRRKSALVRG